METEIHLPIKIIDNFSQPARHRIFKGGRGSAKTRSLALMAAIKVYQLSEEGREGVWLCSREHLNSLADSSFSEVKTAIKSAPWLDVYFEIGDRFIRTKNRRIEFVFAGLRFNLDSIKSKSRILGNWTDEAENVSASAWQKLIPTIREDNSENWVSYNPETPDSATHKRFIETPDENTIITDINWNDNPFFPKVLEAERLADKKNRPDIYEHIWEGKFLAYTDAQVFKNKFVIKDFSPGDHWNGPYQGVDFGFAQDPTTAIRCWIFDSNLFIEYEAGAKELELDSTTTYFLERIPKFETYAARADSARPESISFLKRFGLPKIQSVKKWPGSIEDGVSFMKSFDEIIIHPRCTGTAREFRLYSYAIDKLSGDILPKIVDANNHYMDSLRYALQPLIQARGVPSVRSL